MSKKNNFIYLIFLFANTNFYFYEFNRGKLTENDSLYRISKEQFENLLDRIKSGS